MRARAPDSGCDGEQVEYLLCAGNKIEGLPDFNFSVQIFKKQDAVTEIQIPGSYGTQKYHVTNSSESYSTAVEVDPETPDSAGTVQPDRVKGELEQQNKISLEAVTVLKALCNGEINSTLAKKRCKNLRAAISSLARKTTLFAKDGRLGSTSCQLLFINAKKWKENFSLTATPWP